jgi:DNA polymerase-1
MNTLLLIDGNPIMHRSFHALPPFKAEDGTPTNVLYGFFSIIHKLIADFHPEYIACCFDTPKPTFRNKLFKDYQAQRPKVEDDFIVQIPLVKEALDKGGVFRLEKDGYEADDLIGTMTKIFSQNDIRVLIVTGDKDILQLVNDKVFVASPQLGLSNIKVFDTVEVERKLGIKPNQIPDFKALAGDPSDNYPGARGIGPKTAATLLAEFQTLDGLYKNINSVSSEKIKKALTESKDDVFLSKKLATVITNVEITPNIEEMKFKGFKTSLKDYLLKYQINSLVKRIFENKLSTKPKPAKKEKQMGLF